MISCEYCYHQAVSDTEEHRPPPSLTDEDIDALSNVGSRVRFPAGSVLIQEGEQTDFVLYISDGHITIVRTVGERTAPMTFLRGTGTLVGEMSAVTGQARIASVRALTDVTAWIIPGAAWLDFLHQRPPAMFTLLHHTMKRLGETTAKAADSLLGSEQKFAKLLLDLVAHGLTDPHDGAQVVRFTQQELADFTGVSRESLTQAIKHLKSLHILSTGRQKLYLHNIPSLEVIAAGKPGTAES